jgi:hypothetical protein
VGGGRSSSFGALLSFGRPSSFVGGRIRFWAVVVSFPGGPRFWAVLVFGQLPSIVVGWGRRGGGAGVGCGRRVLFVAAAS